MTVLAAIWRWVTRRASGDLVAAAADGHAATLAEYSAVSAKLSELERQKRHLRKVVEAIPVDEVFDGWRKRYGEPAEITDKDALDELLAARGLALPKKSAAAPLIVEFVGDRHEMREGSAQ